LSCLCTTPVSFVISDSNLPKCVPLNSWRIAKNIRNSQLCDMLSGKTFGLIYSQPGGNQMEDNFLVDEKELAS
jgi:hypothetical protein